MKKIVILLISLYLIGCINNEVKTYRIKVIDKSSYDNNKTNNINNSINNNINNNNAPIKQDIKQGIEPEQNQKDLATNNLPTRNPKESNLFQRPVNAKVLRPYNIENDFTTYDTIKGSDVRSIRHGKVIYSGNNLEAFGNMVIIEHDYGFYSHYMFNESLLVNVGDRVATSQKIATTSDEKFRLLLKKNITPVNPQDYIQ